MQERVYSVLASIIAAIFLLPQVTHAEAPVISLVYPHTIYTEEKITLDASGTVDPDGDLVSFTWDLGDGTRQHGAVVEHTYFESGEYEVFLYASDSEGMSVFSLLVSVESDSGSGSVAATTLLLSEFIPNPVGSDDIEWIELYNYGASSVDLKDWSLSDASGKTYTFSHDDFESLVISAGSYFVLPREVSGIALNNSSEYVVLMSPHGSVIDETIYDKSFEGHSFMQQDNGVWQWTSTPTPGTANIQTSNQKDKDKSVESEQEAKEEQRLPITEATESVIGSIIFTELFPAPDGDDKEYEFIELYNTTTSTVHINDWVITDGSREFTFSATINAHSYKVFEREETNIALNNTGDTVWLYDALGIEIDVVSYEKAHDDFAYAQVNGTWEWVEDITPGEKTITNQQNSVQNNAFVTITQAKELPDQADVTVQGRVTTVPGQLQNRITYIQDQQSGIQVYFHAANWPFIEEGDIVSVSGEMRTAYGERRIGITSTDNIEVIPQGEAVEPREYNCSNDQVGMLVSINGEVTKKDGSYVHITTEECDVLVKRDLLSDSIKGDILFVSGVLQLRGDRIYASPRSSNDVNIQVSTEEDEKGEVLGKALYAIDDQGDKSLYYSLYLLSAAIITLLMIVGAQRLRHHYNH
ncbi:MAG: lamin tail domain-containing protein [Patescibacteria group bacterium]